MISNQYNKKNYLYQQFQKSRHLFDSENRVDHVLKRAQKKIELKNEQPIANTARANKSKIVNEQRLEILDFYEMNQKLIEKRKESQEENEKLFIDMKKLSEMSAQTKKITRGDPNLSTLQRIQTSRHLPIRELSSNLSPPSFFYRTKNTKSSTGNLKDLSPIRTSNSKLK